MRKAVLAGLAWAGLATVAFGQQTKPATPSALDKASLEAYLRHQFLIPATVQFSVEEAKPSEIPGMMLMGVNLSDGGQMKQRVEFYVSKDGRKMIQGKVFDIAESPFASDLKLLGGGGHPSLGPANAAVDLEIFSDFQCQYCREAAKTIRANVEKEYADKVRIVFRDFPLEQIHPWAKPAAIAGRCVNKLDAAMFWQYHDWVFEQQANLSVENLKQKTLEFLNGKVDTLQLTQCIDAKATAKEVEQSMATARELQVASTPTLFVNGRRVVGNASWPDLKRVVDYEIGYAAKHGKPGEPCCEVKLPIPGAK
ncbi:MAG: thioredoxin domain-containing protein [Bryobacterales bacterium]|nr:thioredoxin domain-containing protein [Bryobacterales bacterium]